jgi:hypothetical protein
MVRMGNTAERPAGEGFGTGCRSRATGERYEDSLVDLGAIEMRIFLAAGAAIALLIMGTPGYAEPLEYVKVCDTYGKGWFYIPGTEHCVQTETGEVRWETEDGTQYGTLESVTKASEGVAISLSLPGATIDAGKTFGLGLNVGTFGGESAVGIDGAIKAADGVTLNGGVGVGTQGDVGGRAGVNLSW